LSLKNPDFAGLSKLKKFSRIFMVMMWNWLEAIDQLHEHYTMQQEQGQ
jgi:hypothetical protein